LQSRNNLNAEGAFLTAVFVFCLGIPLGILKNLKFLGGGTALYISVKLILTQKGKMKLIIYFRASMLAIHYLIRT
jgi:hypothetical protein